MRRCSGLIAAMGLCLVAGVVGQTAPPEPAAPLLERFVGHWTMTGTVRGRPATYRLDVAWVLAHRFVELHMKDVGHTPAQYEARVFIGPDTLPGRVLGHWLDSFGAAYSVPPATGIAAGDTLTLDLTLSGRGVPRHLRTRPGDGHVDDPVGCSRWDRGMEAFRRLPGDASVSTVSAATDRQMENGRAVQQYLQSPI
jgi:hypothetical protein